MSITTGAITLSKNKNGVNKLNNLTIRKLTFVAVIAAVYAA